mgnify:CR=1 FL=1
MAAHPERLELEERRAAARRARAGRLGDGVARPPGDRSRPRPVRRFRIRPPCPAMSLHAYCSEVGVDSPYWLFSTMNSTGSFHTAARLTASWKSPSLVDPSPVNAAATRFSPRSCVGEREPVRDREHRAQVRDHADDAMVGSDPKWNVRSRPLVKPPSLPRSWRNSCARSTPRVVKTPRFRCIGRMKSSGLERRASRRPRSPPGRSPRTTWRASPAAAGSASSLRSSGAGRSSGGERQTIVRESLPAWAS